MPSADDKRSSKNPATQKAQEQDGKKQLSLSVCRSAVKVAQMGSWICMFHSLLLTATSSAVFVLVVVLVLVTRYCLALRSGAVCHAASDVASIETL